MWHRDRGSIRLSVMCWYIMVVVVGMVVEVVVVVGVVVYVIDVGVGVVVCIWRSNGIK